MFIKTVLLFFLGATVVSSQFIPKLRLKPGGCPPTPELAPMICQFMQQSLQLQYKPQLIAPTTYIPPLVIEKCDTPQLQKEIHLPLPVEKKPIVIPEPPVLPPITLPKFPVPVIIEKPVLPALPIAEPCEPALVPELPPRELPVLPQIVSDFKPMAIPQPPKLPAFVMPELPVRVSVPPTIVEPCPEDQPMQVIPVPYVQSMATIPVAPELPPAHLPELPVRIEIPSQPILPPMVIEERVEEPCITEEMVTRPLAPIPAAPELPPARLPELPVRIEIPAQPILPPMVIEERVEEPCITEEMVTRPLAPIPAAPELPPARLPELPVRIEIPTQPILPPMLIEERVEEPCITDEIMVTRPLAPIPAAPELPPARLPELPVRIEIPAQPIFRPMVIEEHLEEPCLTGEIMVAHPLAPITAPSALPPARLPELPVRVEFPTQPILPPIIVDRPADEPCITGEVMVAQPEPILIRHPPKVPQFIMPEPLKVEVMKPMPILSAYPEGAMIAEPCDPSTPALNTAQLPPYFVRHLPYHAVLHSNKFKKYVVPRLPYMRI